MSIVLIRESKHDPVIEGFPGLVEKAGEVCSRGLATYMIEDVGLDADHYLERMGMAGWARLQSLVAIPDPDAPERS
jgi:hypothetical protein